MRLADCGKNVLIDTGVYIQSPKDISFGSNIWIDKNVIILAGTPNLGRKIKIKKNNKFSYAMGHLVIDDFVHIAPNVIIQAHGGVSIGSKSGVASGSQIYSLSHHYRNLLDRNDYKRNYFTPMVNSDEQALLLSPVVIGSGCALSLNSIVLPGTVVPDNVWFSVGMVIGGSNYESNSVYFTEQKMASKKIN
jgi:acetyltransferase-like isoleucine patch superfamily enzyme